MTDRGTIHRVSAGPYTLALPANGVAILYEHEKQLPGGVGYLDALVQFAGEVIRLRSMLDTIRRDPEITDPRDPYKRRDVVAELDAWLGAWEGPDDYRLTVKRARDEIVALQAFKARVFADVRAEALEEAAHECDEEAKASSEGFRDGCETCAAAIRALTSVKSV